MSRAPSAETLFALSTARSDDNCLAKRQPRAEIHAAEGDVPLKSGLQSEGTVAIVCLKSELRARLRRAFGRALDTAIP
eukprot:4968156-Pleurochrysis_carterae.AAC.1